MYQLPVYQKIKSRLEEPRRFIQVIMGPRQVGKSTVIKQVLDDLEIPYTHFSADNVPATDRSWIENCWQTCRQQLNDDKQERILVIDEIQKINNWSEIVKKLWDEDTFHNRAIKVVLLGSSRVLLEKGLSESLAGRYEEVRMSHWSFKEMRDCFGMTLNEYIYYGGYPGAASLLGDVERYDHYLQSSIIDASINKDIMMGNAIAKPALLRQTFELACAYSGQILSFTKMLGQLQDAGNVTTLSHYLHLLDEACLVGALMKYADQPVRMRGSIPKFQVYDNALSTIFNPLTFQQVLSDSRAWGRVFESAIGSYILSEAFLKRIEVFYWRDGGDEVDYVLRHKGRTVAIEVKSNYENVSKGLEAFRKRFDPVQSVIVGKSGIPAETFLSMDLRTLF